MSEEAEPAEEAEEAESEGTEGVFDSSLWEPVGDLEEPDLPDPVALQDEEVIDNPWGPVSDRTSEDLSPIDPTAEEDELPDPWGPLDMVSDPLDALPSPAPPVVVPPSLMMPPMHEWGDSNVPARSLPWRTTARVTRPDLGELICIADPSTATSQLLVAGWEWQGPGESGDLLFRVNDDGPECRATAVGPGVAMLECELELAGELVDVLVQLVSAREDRGLRLGRDLLGQRFLIDPSRDETETD